MERYESARNYVYSKYARLFNPALMEAAFTHTSSVDNFITLLAISRDIPLETAKIAALFHDFARFAENCPARDHARLSSLYAHRYLNETRAFDVQEIDEICCAIASHSRKAEFGDDPLSEALKDADVLASFVEDPNKELDPVRKRRLQAAVRDLS